VNTAEVVIHKPDRHSSRMVLDVQTSHQPIAFFSGVVFFALEPTNCQISSTLQTANLWGRQLA
jgi:hypothetical protein